MNSEIGRVFVIVAGVSALLNSPALATPPVATTDAEAALVLCHRAERLPDHAGELLERGLELAESAVSADESDPRARLAVFCNLGKQLELGGLGFGSWGTVRRLRREIDRAHQLAPDDPDVLAAKGALLVQLPRMFGGDSRQGEALLLRSLSIRSGNEKARRYLAMALAARGAEVGAVAISDRGTATELDQVAQASR